MRAVEAVIRINEVALCAGAERGKSLALLLDALVKLRADHGAGLTRDNRFLCSRQGVGKREFIDRFVGVLAGEGRVALAGDAFDELVYLH